MKLLDLGKMKKMSGDDKSTLFKHADGHEIRIIHAALPKIQQEQIKRLPSHEEKKMAKGGEVRKLADGTDDGPLEIEKVDPNSADAQPDSSAQNQQPQTVAPVTINVGQPQGQAAPSPQPPAPPPVAPNFNPSQSAPAAAPQAQPNLLNPQNIAATQGQSLEQAQQAGNLQQAIDTARAQGSVPLAQQQIAAQLEAQKRYNATIQDMAQHTDQFAQYMQNNPINPTAYTDNMKSGQKITTALGLLLGGMAGKGQGNVAMDYLNNQINRDIDAQKARSNQAATVYGAYQSLYNNENASTNLAKASRLDQISAEANKLTAQLGTAQAAANNQTLQSNLLASKYASLKDAAGYAAAMAPQTPPQQPPQNQTMGQPGVQTGPQQGNESPTRILSPDAEQKYRGLLYDPTKTPEQKADITNQYNAAVQADKALQQIDQLFPQLEAKATWGGYLADKINPNIVGATMGTAAEGLGAAVALPTGGTSLAAAVPGALLAGAAGAGVGHAVKQGLTALGGQQQTQYETARASLIGMIGSALAGSNVTPTEIGELADRFIPTKIDSAETARDKLKKLKEKIVTLTRTSALDTNGMTNK